MTVYLCLRAGYTASHIGEEVWSMAKCVNCRKEVDDSAEVCPHCGQNLSEPIVQQKPHCGTPKV